MVIFTFIPFPIFLAEAAKETEVDYEEEMNGLQSSDDDYDDDGSDGEMDDTEEGDEAQSVKLQKLAAQVCEVFVSTCFCEAWFFFAGFDCFPIRLSFS